MRDPLVVQALQSEIAGRGTNIGPACGDRELAEHILVQGGFDDVPGIVFYEAGAIAAVRRGDQLPVQAAHAHGVDPDVLLVQLVAQPERLAFMVFAVGDEDDRTVRFRALFEAVDGRPKALGYGCSAPRNDADIRVVERHQKGGVVDGERAFKETAAGERDEANAIALELADKIAHTPLRLLEPVGLDVLGQHAPRRVENNHDVQPPPFHLLPVKAPLGPRKRQARKTDCDKP